MRKHIRILLIAVTFIGYSVVNAENLDSLLRCIPSQKTDSTHYLLLAKIAIAYSDSNYNKSLDYSQQALLVAEKINRKNFVADSYQQIGFCYEKMGEFTLALKNFNHAADIYTALNDKKNLAGVLNDIGLIYRNWGKYDKALDHYLKAQKFFDEIPDVEGSSIVSNSIGQIYFYQENHAKAIEYFIRYLNTSIELSKTRAVAAASNNIASAYLEIEKYPEALEYYLKALKIYDSLDIKIGVAIIRDNIGSLFYLKQQYDDALLYHNNALIIFKELNSPQRISSTLKNIGMVYLKQGRFNLAISVLNESLALSEKSGQKSDLKDIYQTLSEAYQGSGDYAQAYSFLKRHNTLKDSILNAESIEKVERLQAEYEAERRENELASINRQLEVQRKILYAFFGFAVILVALLLLLLKENIAKRKAIRDIESLKSKILDKISSTYSNMNIFGHKESLAELFSETWQITPQYEGCPNVHLFHFKINETTFLYLLVIKNPNINPELINITVYNLASEALKDNLAQVSNLGDTICQKLTEDPLTSSYSNKHYQVIPILLNKNKVFSLAGDCFTVRQAASLIPETENRWLNIKKDDIIYLYTSINEEELTDTKRTIRKIFRTLNQLDFNEQQEVARNYLESIEMDDSAIIFALKV